MGYTHDTHMCQYIPPTLIHYVTGTWTNAAGAVADTIAKTKAAGDVNPVINVPVIIPGSATAEHGSKLVSIEVDYEIKLAAVTSVTPVLNKVTRGAEGAVAVVTTPAITYTPAANVLNTEEQHKLVVTLTTPEWVDNDVYYLLELTVVSGGAVSTIDVLAAVVNYTLRI